MKNIYLVLVLILGLGFQSLSQIPTDNLRAYYPFNGNANDETGNGNDGWYSSDQDQQPQLISDRFGNLNSAYNFDGNDYIRIGTLPGIENTLNDISLSFWVYIEHYSGNNSIFGSIRETLPKMELSIEFPEFNFDYLQFTLSDNSENKLANYPDSDVLYLFSWMHLVFIINDASQSISSIYVDGSKVIDNYIYQENPQNFSAFVNDFTIGALSGNIICSRFRGRIDDIRIYDDVLTESEINALYTETWYPTVAAFEADNTNPDIGEIVNFTDLSTNNPTSWSWVFDPSTVTYVDGTNSNSQNPKVQFDPNGYYNVTLTVTNSYNTSTETKEDYINCYIHYVDADFIADNTNPRISDTVTFTDLSTYDPTSWEWSFNPSTVTYMNGTNSNSQNPEVKFNSLGYYTVSLTATNNHGADTETKNDYINVEFPPLKAYYPFNGNAQDESGNGNHGTNHGATQANDRFGNPNSSYLFDGINDYIDIGTLPAIHITLNDLSISFWSKLSDPMTDFEAIFGSINIGAKMNLSINFHRESNNTTAFYLRDNLDRMVLNTPSTEELLSNDWNHYVYLINDASQSITSIYVNGEKLDDIYIRQENPDEFVAFQFPFVLGAMNDRSFIRNFYSGFLDDFRIYYSALSEEEISLLFEGDNIPIADFVADNTNPVLGETVYFTDLSTNDPTSWEWGFAPSNVTYVNGTSSTSQNPEVQFNSINTFTVELTSTNSGGSGTEIKNDYISTINILTITANANPSEICIGNNSQLECLPSGGTGNYTFFWTSDPPGFNSDIQNPVVQPDVTTTYIVEVDDGVEVVSDNVTVTVNPLPEIILDWPETLCNQSEPPVQLVSYPDGGIYIGEFVTSTGIFYPETATIGWNVITYEYEDDNGCVNSKQDSIYVDECVGIFDNKNDNQVQIYSNLNNGEFTIQLSSDFTMIGIYNLNGSLIYEKRIEGISNIKINLKEFPEGMYFIKFISPKSQITKKIFNK